MIEWNSELAVVMTYSSISFYIITSRNGPIISFFPRRIPFSLSFFIYSISSGQNTTKGLLFDIFEELCLQAGHRSIKCLFTYPESRGVIHVLSMSMKYTIKPYISTVLHENKRADFPWQEPTYIQKWLFSDVLHIWTATRVRTITSVLVWNYSYLLFLAFQ
jgi:hypothetical protein